MFKHRVLVVAASAVLFNFIYPAPSQAACPPGSVASGNICVRVYASGGQIIISAKKSVAPIPATTSPATPKPPTPRPKPTTKVTPKPTPKVTPVKVVTKQVVKYSPRPYPYRPYTPRPRPVVHAVATTAPVAGYSLSQQLSNLLPTSQIHSLPNGMGLTGLPVYFWSDTPSSFQTLNQLLGLGIGVNLTPTFTWDYGDGTSATLPFSDVAGLLSSNQHTYQNAGTYLVRLLINWNGSWSMAGASYVITGSLLQQVVSLPVVIAPAPSSVVK